ncbi:MAG: hypothetical protein WAV54_05825 [Acidimicrobiales bacterium]
MAESGAPKGDRDRRERPQAVLLVPLKATRQPLAASGAPKGDRDRRERPQAVLLVPLKAARRPLAASGALGRWAPALVVQERLVETKAALTLGNSRPRAPPNHKPRPAEPSRASNRERSIAIS